MTSDQRTLAEALTEAAKTINSPPSLEETLDAVVRATVQTVPGFNHVGISVIDRDGVIETKAGTDQLVWTLDRLQYDLDEGPCVQAIRSDVDDRAGDIVVVDFARHEQRWPDYIASAVKVGIRSQLAIKLHGDGRSLGGLNLYSTESDTVEDEAVQAARMFAAHAAIALGHAFNRHHLKEALTSRQVIGQATGVIMQRYQIDDRRAFDFLVRASATTETKLRDVARQVVDDANATFSPGAGQV
jgi:GAF domain-containing protein